MKCMKKLLKVGLLFVCGCVMLGGTAVAADQHQFPEILASLTQSDSVILLDDQRMGQIQGTFLPAGHPGLRASIRAFLSDPCGTIRAHRRIIIRSWIAWHRARWRCRMANGNNNIPAD
jgi:hypothetical protein